MNDLTGLTLNGFQEPLEEFDSAIFDSIQSVPILRKEIKKFLEPRLTNNRSFGSYGLKHHAEKHIGEYVENGTFIYAMHLEGYKIFKSGINCTFNISTPSIDHFRCAKSFLDMLKSTTFNSNIFYLRFSNTYKKYKYHILSTIHEKLEGVDRRKKKLALPIVAKELGINIRTFESWCNLKQYDSEEIPDLELARIAKVLDLSISDLTNN